MQAEAGRAEDGEVAGRGVEFGEDVFELAGDGAVLDGEGGGDALVGPALDEHSEDLQFERGEAAEVSGRDSRTTARSWRASDPRTSAALLTPCSSCRRWAEDDGLGVEDRGPALYWLLDGGSTVGPGPERPRPAGSGAWVGPPPGGAP